MPVGGLLTTYRVAPAGTASTYVQSEQMGLLRSEAEAEGMGVPDGKVTSGDGLAYGSGMPSLSPSVSVAVAEGLPDLAEGDALGLEDGFDEAVVVGVADLLVEPVGSPPVTTATSVMAKSFLLPAPERVPLVFFGLDSTTLRKVIPALASAGVNSMVCLPTRLEVCVVVSETGLADADADGVAVATSVLALGEGVGLGELLAGAEAAPLAAPLAAGLAAAALGEGAGFPAAPTA